MIIAEHHIHLSFLRSLPPLSHSFKSRRAQSFSDFFSFLSVAPSRSDLLCTPLSTTHTLPRSFSCALSSCFSPPLPHTLACSLELCCSPSLARTRSLSCLLVSTPHPPPFIIFLLPQYKNTYLYAAYHV